MRPRDGFTRREFLKKGALTALGLSVAGVRVPGIGATADRAKVVISRNDSALSANHEVNSRALESMLDNAVAALTGKDAPDAWRSLFDSRETVGIKVNALAGRRLSTHPELAFTVAEKLISVGVKPHKIIIWDKADADLRNAGYQINRTGNDIRCYGTNSDYEPEPTVSRSIASCFSTILRQCTALVNLPVLKQHELAGVTIALKNWFGAIDNPNKYHDNGCDPFVADLNAVHQLRNKKRLVICDALLAQYEAGPGYKARYAWRENSLIVSRDPVALDRVGMEIIDNKRKEDDDPQVRKPLRTRPEWCSHIFTAADREHNLGIADLNQIDLIRA